MSSDMEGTFPQYGSFRPAGSPCADPNEDPAPAQWRARLFACLLCLGVVGEGYDWSVMNGAAVRIQEDFGCSTLQIAIMVSMTPFGVMLGTLLGGEIGDCFGRRWGLFTCCVVLSVTPVLMALATEVWMLIACRCCVGMGIGMGFSLVSTYLAEVSPVAMRGQQISLQEAFLNAGLVLGYVASWSLLGVPGDWRWMIGLGAIFPLGVGIALLFPWVPESPRWLFLKGRHEEAFDVLERFAGSLEARQAMMAMREGLETKQLQTASWGELFQAYGYPLKRRALIAAMVVAVAQTASGYLGLVFFSNKLFMMSSMTERDAFLSTIVIGLVKLLVCVAVLLVLERVGRRPLLLWSLAGTTVSSVLIGVAFWRAWGPIWQVLAVSLFMASFSLGLGPVCFVYVAEVFESSLRAKGISLALCLGRVVGFANVLTFPLVVEAFGVPWTMCWQVALNLLMLAAAWVFIRETQGHTLESMYKVWKSDLST